MPPVQEVEADLAEPTLEVGDEGEGLVGQDALGALDWRTRDDHAGRCHHDTSERRIVASMSPCGSVVAT